MEGVGISLFGNLLDIRQSPRLVIERFLGMLATLRRLRNVP